MLRFHHSRKEVCRVHKRSFRALALMFCACLVIGLAVSSTVAYFAVKTASLVNTFVPGDVPPVAELKVPLTVNKTVVCTGNEKIGPGGFRFALNDSVTGKNVTTLTSDENGLAKGELTFTYDDIGKTFGYLLSEINDGQQNVTYSEQTYYIQVKIMLDEAQDVLVPVLHVNGKVAYKLEAAFENMYYVETPVPPTGDETPLMLLAAVLVISACGMAAVALPQRKREN